MKTLLNLFFVIAALSTPVFAQTNETAPVLNELSITEVSAYGNVLKRNEGFGAIPTSQILVGIPVKVSTGSVCVDFAGQQTTQVPGMEVIKAIGATDPMIDACIEIFPMPVDSVLTTTFEIRFDPRVRLSSRQTKIVRIGKDVYTLTLNLGNDSVMIEPKTMAPIQPRPIF